MLRSLFNQQNHLGRSSQRGRWSMRIFQNWRRCSRFAAWTTTSSSLFSKTSRTSAKDWLSTRRRWLYSLRRSGSIFRRLFFVNATYIYIGGPDESDTHAHFASSHHGWEISHEWGSPSWKTSWKGIHHFVVKYRLQEGEITELKLQEYVTATKTHIRTMDFVIDNIDDFHNKYVAMMKWCKADRTRTRRLSGL